MFFAPIKQITHPMNRREFFDGLLQNKSQRNINAGLNPYSKPLSKTEVYHLLKRTTFRVDPSFAQTLVGKTASEAVDTLINNRQTNPAPPATLDLNYAFPNPNVLSGNAAFETRYQNQLRIIADNDKLLDWWLTLIKNDTKSLHERLNFFWHGHFTTAYTANDFIPGQMMYTQNALFRQMQLGKFSEFLEKITLDGAMLFYLNGNTNKSEAPNENYARELLELYSVGIGDGHYTEDDIRQIAKMLTGWNSNIFANSGVLYTPNVNVGLFDSKEKTVFGEKVTFDHPVNQENIKKHSINKLIELIISKKGDYVAKFIADKLYHFFVYSDPNYNNSTIINELANVFKSSGFDMGVLLKTLLKSEHFFDEQNHGLQIKSPLDLYVGISGLIPIDIATLKEELKKQGLELLNPPNVSGWKGYQSWINTKTLPYYINYLNNGLQSLSNEAVAQWAEKLGDFNNAEKLTKNLVDLLAGKPLAAARQEKLMQALLGGAPYYEWPQLSQNKANAGLRIKVLLKAIFKLPDFYLS